MWPFKKPEQQEPLPTAPVRPCWCGSRSFERIAGYSLGSFCLECGAVYAGVGEAKHPCGYPDLRNPKDAA